MTVFLSSVSTNTGTSYLASWQTWSVRSRNLRQRVRLHPAMEMYEETFLNIFLNQKENEPASLLSENVASVADRAARTSCHSTLHHVIDFHPRAAMQKWHSFVDPSIQSLHSFAIHHLHSSLPPHFGRSCLPALNQQDVAICSARHLIPCSPHFIRSSSRLDPLCHIESD